MPLPLRVGCAAGCPWPCRLRFPIRRSAAGSARAPAASLAHRESRRNSATNPPCRIRAPAAAELRIASSAIRCIASPQRISDRRSIPNFPARPQLDIGRQNLAPYAPWLRSRRNRRADGTCRSHHRRCAPISSAWRLRRGRVRSLHKRCAAAPASIRRPNAAAHGPGSRTSNNRGRRVPQRPSAVPARHLQNSVPDLS